MEKNKKFIIWRFAILIIFLSQNILANSDTIRALSLEGKYMNSQFEFISSKYRDFGTSPLFYSGKGYSVGFDFVKRKERSLFKF